MLFRQASIVVFDEPTAVLTPQEIEEFFRIVESLRADGKGIVFITHKLREALRIADRIVVLRRGKTVGEVLPGDTDERELAAMMVGRPVELTVHKAPAQPGEVGARRRRSGGPRPRRTSARRPRVVRRPRRRGGRHRRRAGQRADRAGRSARRPASGRSPVASRSAGKDVTHDSPAPAPLRWAGPHPRGPPARRDGQGLHGVREPGPHRLLRPSRTAAAR